MTDNKSDPVNHPSHYADSCSIECIESMMVVLGREGLISFCIGNAYKYIWRHKFKGKPAEDLKKAKWYIDKAFKLDQDWHHKNQINGLLDLYIEYSHDLKSSENDKEEARPAPMLCMENVDDLM